jgi:hypothetical protein
MEPKELFLVFGDLAFFFAPVVAFRVSISGFLPLAYL